MKRLTAMGFSNVRIEPFTMPVWTRGAESAEILSLYPQKLAIAALGYSGSTGPAGITGQIAYFESLDALRLAPDSAVRGKIVFIDHHMMPSQDGTRYFDIHHTADDTLDKVDPAQLRQNVAAWTAMLAVLSGGIESQPKQPKRR